MNVIIVIVALFVVVSLGWRLWSGRQSLPCPSWLAWMVELDNPLFRNNRAAAIVAGLDIAPGMTALDVGCGPGRVAIPLAKAVGPQGHVVCLDLQAGMLAKARDKAAKAGLDNLEFRQAAIGTGTLERAAFDRAVMATVLGEIPDKAAALAEVVAALKPSGILAITEVIADPHFQSRASVIRLAESVGLREAARTGGRLSYTLYFRKGVA